MKHILQTLLNKIYIYIKNNWLSMLIGILLAFDVIHYTSTLENYNKKTEVIQYKHLFDILNTSESNNSIEKVKVTEMLSRISSEGEVYIVKEGAQNFSVLAQEANATMVVKHIPYMTATTMLSNALLEKSISYAWIQPIQKPKLFITNLFDLEVISFLLMAYLVYLFMESSGIKIFKKEYQGLLPNEIEGSFNDLVGYEDIKIEVQQLEHIISQQEKYAEYGIEGTFNILFSGKAGTGKSKFALYLAKELNVPIVSTTGSLDEIYVGSGAKKIREIFKEAHEQAERSSQKTCILFIDEGEKLLRVRGRSVDNKWEDDTANELLAHLDGVEENNTHNIIVIMASNFHAHNMKMDSAMLRRFNKKIHFRVPNLDERIEILKHYVRKIEKREKVIDFSYLAKNMTGMTPAIIESVVQEAGLLALREEKLVGDEVLLQAFERSVIGSSSRAIGEGKNKVRKQIAIHELGHFLVEYHRAVKLSNGDMKKAKTLTRILKISSESVEQIGALGFAMKEADEEIQLKSVDDMEWEVRQLYGGLAAEQSIYGKQGVSTGSSNDIEKATGVLQHMINQNNVYSPAKLNYELLGVDEKRVNLLEKKAKALFEESLEIMVEHEALLQYLSKVLLESWSLNKEELFEVIDRYFMEKEYLDKSCSMQEYKITE